MADQVSLNEQALQAEIARLNKMVQALMDRAERNESVQGSYFNMFQTAITLEDLVRRRTEELEAVSRENEKITRALRESENHNRILIENSPMGIHEIDMAGRITSMNRAGLLMLGLKQEHELMLGLTQEHEAQHCLKCTEKISQAMEGAVQGCLYLNAVSRTDRERIGALLTQAYAGKTSHFEFKGSGARGQIYKSCFVPIKNTDGSVEKLMGLTEDITEHRQAEEQVRRIAFYDPLTQLANRRLMNDRLGQAIAANKRSGRYGAVIFLDLDNFKPLNDTYGHEVGDLLLIEVAHRLTRCVREMDTVARFGGDEFVVMLGELDTDKQLSIAEAGKVAEKIRATLAEPYLLTRKQDGHAEATVEHHCTSSIGAVLFINHEASQEEVLKWADMAMYQAKEGGKNQVKFFEPCKEVCKWPRNGSLLSGKGIAKLVLPSPQPSFSGRG
jgi:diguanylate cyclase (GGDEF)-like protein/PAS domain S-box-containing protein